MPWRLVGSYRLAPEPDGSPLFTSSPSVTCQRYEPRKRPNPLAVSRYRDAAFPVERSGRPLRSRSISGLTLRSLAFRPATFLSTLRSGCYQTPRKTRYTAAWLRLCRGRHFRRLNSTRLQGATLTEPYVKLSLNERLRRGGRKRRLGLEAPNYLVVGIRESVLEETTVTPLRPGPIDALILVGLALRPPEPLSSRATRLGNDTLQPVVHPAPDVSVVRRTPQSFWW